MRNIALMAHVDAGKTTLTERLLYTCGAIRSMGDVDSGTARTDDLPVERQRGISVRSVLTSAEWKGIPINIIDTPGHFDFTPQIERAFWAADGIVVLVSAVEGVQSNTEMIINALQKEKLPAIFFINKCDRNIADADRVKDELKQLCPSVVNIESERDMLEAAAENDDYFLALYAEGKTPDKRKLRESVNKLSREGKLYPVLKGSAVTGEGVSGLLDCVADCLPPPADKADMPLSAVVFSVEHDKSFGRGAYIRVFSGKLSVRDVVGLNGSEYKIAQILTMRGGKLCPARDALCGNIALVYGLSNCKTGDIIGDGEAAGRKVLPGILQTPLLTVKAAPPPEIDSLTLKKDLEQLVAEDPPLI